MNTDAVAHLFIFPAWEGWNTLNKSKERTPNKYIDQMRNLKYFLLAMGIPVVGKGVQGDIAAFINPTMRKYVMRDLIENKKAGDEAFKALALKHEEDGDLIPCDLINKLVSENVVSPRTADTIIWLDGGGRTADQLRHLYESVLKGVPPDRVRVAHFKMDPELAEKRFMQSLGAADRVKRHDGKLETYRKRTREHLDREPELLALCRRFHWQVATIDAARPPIDVHRDMRQKLSLGRLSPTQVSDVRDFLRHREQRIVQFKPPVEVVLKEA